MSAERQRPKVSVCIPAYNAAPFLRAAIDSVLMQDFADYEVVVSDDASDDGSAQIYNSYNDSRIRPIRSEHRLGQSGNWNRCLELARGEYIILLNADDFLLADYLARAVALLDNNPDVGLIHCAVQHVDDGENALSIQRLFDRDVVDREESTLRRLLLDGCVINSSAALVRKVVYQTVGAFSEKITWGQDWHMWIRVALRYPIAYLAEPLAAYRHHGQNLSASNMTLGRNGPEERWAAEDLFGRIARQRPELVYLKEPVMRGVAHRTWCVAEAMCQQGNMSAARINLRNAVTIWPGMLLQSRTWALWAATYTGYRYFAAAHTRKQKLARMLSRRVQASH